MNPQIIDGIVILILLLSVAAGIKRGLLLTVFKICSFAISLFLSFKFYPYVGKFLREKAGIYEKLNAAISTKLSLGDAIQNETLKVQNDFINNLGMPDIISKSLVQNNNPEIYKILNVNGIEQYISGYIANICINILSLLLVFMVVGIMMSIVVKTLDIISMLPVVSSLNKVGGALVGFAQGTLIIWFVFMIMTFFITSLFSQELFEGIQKTTIALKFYNTNLLMEFIMKVIA